MFDRNRPRRSVLYIPGSKERALEKAKTLPADALIFDLEDAVAPDGKVEARETVKRAVKAGGYGQREIAIRINGLDTPWGMDDLKAACEAAPDAILLPKVQSSGMIEELDKLMRDFGAPDSTYIWAMMETPLGVLNAQSIATAHPRLTVMVMGTNDLAADLHAAQVENRYPLMPSLQQCLLVARSFGLIIIDGVYNEFKNTEGFKARCLQSRRMGYDGMTLIHPVQVEVCNDAFAPSPEAIDLAMRQIKAYEEALAAGEGVAVVDGKIVENLHVDTAQKTIAAANAIRSMRNSQG